MSVLPFKQKVKNYSLSIYYRIKEVLQHCCCCFNMKSELENNYELDEIIIVNNDDSIKKLEPGKIYNRFKYINSYSSEEVIYDRDNNIQNKNDYNSIKNDNKNDDIEKNLIEDNLLEDNKTKIPIKNKNKKKKYRKNAKRIRNTILNAKKIKKTKFEKIENELNKNNTENLVDSNNNFLNYKKESNSIIDNTITNKNFESVNVKSEDDWEVLQ
uniref:Uncharacterized protein n=1 Tax=Mimiviridae sp. ChoanoV1 TaxID=2596887 RepID=A0A5B8HW10_9VIRU|nr:hypothetical protein 1_238 [Mimiviridae sp. ChoanoV1]